MLTEHLSCLASPQTCLTRMHNSTDTPWQLHWTNTKAIVDAQASPHSHVKRHVCCGRDLQPKHKSNLVTWQHRKTPCEGTHMQAEISVKKEACHWAKSTMFEPRACRHGAVAPTIPVSTATPVLYKSTHASGRHAWKNSAPCVYTTCRQQHNSRSTLPTRPAAPKYGRSSTAPNEMQERPQQWRQDIRPHCSVIDRQWQGPRRGPNPLALCQHQSGTVSCVRTSSSTAAGGTTALRMGGLTVTTRRTAHWAAARCSCQHNTIVVGVSPRVPVTCC